MGKYELAETALKKASDLDPKSAFVWNNLGLVAFERGHDQEAFLDFKRLPSWTRSMCKPA
jgi:Flp pilus assembly protein TadD